MHIGEWNRRRGAVEIDAKRKQIAMSLRDAGATQREIGEHFGLTGPAISKMFKKMGQCQKTPGKRRLLGDAHEGRVRDLASRGHTQRAIGRILGCNYQTVGRFMRERGIPLAERSPGIPFVEIRELWESGMTQEEIADVYGVSQGYISRFMIANGVLLMNRRKPKG